MDAYPNRFEFTSNHILACFGSAIKNDQPFFKELVIKDTFAFLIKNEALCSSR
jgi:hypothetical protein